MDIPRSTLRLGAVRYDGRVVPCAARQATAVISTVERGDTHPPLRFVRWCSLRGLGVCEEGCLLGPECGEPLVEDRPPG